MADGQGSEAQGPRGAQDVRKAEGAINNWQNRDSGYGGTPTSSESGADERERDNFSTRNFLKPGDCIEGVIDLCTRGSLGSMKIALRPLKFWRRHWFPEEIALKFLASEFAERACLLLGFYAFSDGA
jgi:hypothetical protein